jgi:D-alanine-D-alanine ligase
VKVAIIYDGVATDWTEEEVASVMRPVNEIARILAAEGHHVTRAGVRHDLRWLARARRADLVVNLCEGINGVGRWEDLVTATLELAGIPFTGCRSWTITVCHHKGLVNALLQAHGLPIPRWVVPKGFRVPKDFPLPAIVKPAAEDASVGIEQASVVATRSALEARVARLSETFDEVLVQEFIDGRELAVGFVGNTTLPVSEIDFGRMPAGAWRILSFQGKWEKGHVEDVGSRPVCPAPIDKDLEKRVVAVAQAAWKTVGGSGYGRVDLRVDAAGRPWILEVNPNPDISDDAGLSAMAHAKGWSYPELILRIFEATRAAVQRRESVDRLAGRSTARPARRGRKAATT